jgi:serine/threonine-protein kinase
MTMYRLVNGDNYLPAVSPQDARLLARKGKFPDRGRYRDFVPRPLRTFINKALSVDPVNRFKSAEIMRHALEQVTIEKNWREKHFRNGTEWTCGWNPRCYNVICESDGRGAWNVTVRKGATRKSLKRIGDLSKSGMARTAANQWARRILQDFVLGKLR